MHLGHFSKQRIRITSFELIYDYELQSWANWKGVLKKAALKNFTKFTGKHLYWSVLFLIKLQAWGRQLYEIETPTQVFSC